MGWEWEWDGDGTGMGWGGLYLLFFTSLCFTIIVCVCVCMCVGGDEGDWMEKGWMVSRIVVPINTALIIVVRLSSSFSIQKVIYHTHPNPDPAGPNIQDR